MFTRSLQESWKQKIDWDETLSTRDADEWMASHIKVAKLCANLEICADVSMDINYSILSLFWIRKAINSLTLINKEEKKWITFSTWYSTGVIQKFTWMVLIG